LIDLRKALCRHGSNGPLLQARCRQSSFIKWLIAKKFHANGAHSHGVEVVSDVRGEASGGGKELRNNFERAVTRPDAALHLAGVFGPFGCPTPTREVINPRPLADDDALDSAEALQTVVARPVLTKYRP
jgi:hypothetical protein